MLKHNKFLVGLGLFIIVLASVYGLQYFFKSDGRNIMDNESDKRGLQILSPVFRDGADIPLPYTCKGQNINPPLNIVGVPAHTKSLALIMHDPDAVSGDFVHWQMWDIPASSESIAANTVPVGAVQGLNSAGGNTYMGPCPPAGTGTHRYIFELYALDTALSLNPKTTRDQLKEAIKNHTIAQSTLTGLVKSD